MTDSANNTEKNFLRDLFFSCFDEGVKKVEPKKKENIRHKQQL